VRAALAALVVAAVLAGCGGDDEQTSSATPAPPAAATATPSETPTATPTPTPSATSQPSPTPTPTSAEDQPGGAGDEEAIRVPAEFTISPDLKISPPQIAVPAFFQIEITVRNRSDQPVEVTWAGSKLMTVQAHGGASTIVKGRKKGSYVVSAQPGGDALIVTGAKPGP
jgi:uncharacterized lipoprotein